MPYKKPLTPNQDRVLDVIREILREGRTATYRKIMQRAGYRSVSATHGAVKVLELKGYIRVQRDFRSTKMKLTDKAHATTVMRKPGTPPKDRRHYPCRIRGFEDQWASLAWDRARSRYIDTSYTGSRVNPRDIIEHIILPDLSDTHN